MDLPLAQGFIMPCRGHVEHSDLLRFTDLSDADIFHVVLKVTDVTVTTDLLLKNVFQYWEIVKLVVENTNIQNCNFHTKLQISSLPRNTVTDFALKRQPPLLIVWKTSAKYPDDSVICSE